MAIPVSVDFVVARRADQHFFLVLNASVVVVEGDELTQQSVVIVVLNPYTDLATGVGTPGRRASIEKRLHNHSLDQQLIEIENIGEWIVDQWHISVHYCLGLYTENARLHVLERKWVTLDARLVSVATIVNVSHYHLTRGSDHILCCA